jgi:hypothetical protein
MGITTYSFELDSFLLWMLFLLVKHILQHMFAEVRIDGESVLKVAFYTMFHLIIGKSFHLKSKKHVHYIKNTASLNQWRIQDFSSTGQIPSRTFLVTGQ